MDSGILNMGVRGLFGSLCRSFRSSGARPGILTLEARKSRRRPRARPTAGTSAAGGTTFVPLSRLAGRMKVYERTGVRLAPKLIGALWGGFALCALACLVPEVAPVFGTAAGLSLLVLCLANGGFRPVPKWVHGFGLGVVVLDAVLVAGAIVLVLVAPLVAFWVGLAIAVWNVVRVLFWVFVVIGLLLPVMVGARQE